MRARVVVCVREGGWRAAPVRAVLVQEGPMGGQLLQLGGGGQRCRGSARLLHARVCTLLQPDTQAPARAVGPVPLHPLPACLLPKRRPAGEAAEGLGGGCSRSMQQAGCRLAVASPAVASLGLSLKAAPLRSATAEAPSRSAWIACQQDASIVVPLWQPLCRGATPLPLSYTQSTHPHRFVTTSWTGTATTRTPTTTTCMTR
jgi:hypothetical protein